MVHKVILYTGSYPYGPTTESFVGPELEVISSESDFEVTIVPVVKDSPLRPIPDRIHLDSTICNSSFWYRLRSVFSIFSPRYWSLIYKDKRYLSSLRYCIHLFKYLYAANLVYYDVCKRAKSITSITFYSYWMSYAPIAFGIYRKKHPNTPHHFISRGHGGDVYTIDRGRYYPFRDFVLRTIDHVYIVSNYGRDYLRNKYPNHKEKIDRSYLGVMPLKSATIDSKVSRIVSCSSVYDFKRVDLLYKSLEKYAESHPEMTLEWTHFGGGYLFDSLKEEIERSHNASNLKINLKGRCHNEAILNSYSVYGYHVFIHLSTTEGLPVSMMEAISASIPIIATAVGGVPEIVNDNTGYLLNVDFSQEEFDTALTRVLANYQTFAKNAHQYFDDNFNALNNYRGFYETITSL